MSSNVCGKCQTDKGSWDVCPGCGNCTVSGPPKSGTGNRAQLWEKTTNFRIHRWVYSSGVLPPYIDTLQQQKRCLYTGETRWDNVEVVVEQSSFWNEDGNPS